MNNSTTNNNNIYNLDQNQNNPNFNRTIAVPYIPKKKKTN